MVKQLFRRCKSNDQITTHRSLYGHYRVLRGHVDDVCIAGNGSDSHDGNAFMSRETQHVHFVFWGIIAIMCLSMYGAVLTYKAAGHEVDTQKHVAKAYRHAPGLYEYRQFAEQNK